MDVAVRHNKKTENVVADLGASDIDAGDILIRRMQYHAKPAWMLRSYLHRVEDTAKAA